MAAKPRDWRFDWEEPFLRGSDDLVFKNTPRDIETVLARMGALGARFEFECYDISHLYMLRHFLDRGLVSGPLFLQFVLGVLGGIAAEPDPLVHLQQTAARLFAVSNGRCWRRGGGRWNSPPWPPRWRGWNP